MELRFFSVTQLVLISLARALPLTERVSPLPPTQDSFYQVPDDVQQFAPGTIFKYRKPPAPMAAFGLDPLKLQNTWQILYRTNDNFNKATATVLTVLVPHNADFSKILSYQVAEDASFANCAPSYAFQLDSATGGVLGTIVTQAELLLIEAALERGWVVISPDHEGPEGAYLANKLAGYATLDGIRAALNSTNFTGIKQKPTIAMWGYSGGSIASAWAAELQPSYAPELNIAGAALGGTVPNISTVISTVNKSPFSGLIPMGILGLAHQYPDLGELVNQELRHQYKAAFDKVATQCFTPNMIDFLFKDVVGMVKNPSIFTQGLASNILNENSLGGSIPQIPLYVYKSVLDEVSPIADTDKLVDHYCSGGASVQYERDLLSEHGSLAAIGAAKALS